MPDRLTKYILKQVFNYISHRNDNANIQLIFSNGKSYYTADSEPLCTIQFKKYRAQLGSILLDQIGFIESYARGWIEIDGHNGGDGLEQLIIMATEAKSANGKQFSNPLSHLLQVLHEAEVNNKNRRQAKQNAYAQYSLPDILFHDMLGKTYGYTEGYYPSNAESMDEAQEKKFDYICQKLRLQPGDKLVEVGSGWGYMAVLAAKKYGAEVVNYGLVRNQNVVMQEMIDQAGLGNKVKIVHKDHRELANEPGAYDKYVSIGVYEHAGKDCQEEWISSIATALKPGGIGVISTTAHINSHLLPYLISRHIFPGGNIPSLAKTLEYMETHGLTVVDVESMRYHYMRAVEDWLVEFDKHWAEMKAQRPEVFTEYFRRLWRVYLIGSIEAFKGEHDRLNVYHIVFTKGRSFDLYPNSRHFLYTGAKAIR